MISSLANSLLIVVPTLDSYSLLPGLLESLQRQSWPNWRLVFVDGPSGKLHRAWLDDCCSKDSRCSWVQQDPNYPYIFGAMSQGFALADTRDWILFWGSDDWAASSDVFATAIQAIEGTSPRPDLLVCKGRYADPVSKSLGRVAQFQPDCFLSSASYRRALLLGSIPPHQATLFGPGAHCKIAEYSKSYKLSADLDYFLKISRFKDLRIMCLDLELVHMSVGGVSDRQVILRLREVSRAYLARFGWLWWFPFIARYVRRLIGMVSLSK